MKGFSMDSNMNINRKTKNITLDELMNKHNKTDDGISAENFSNMAKDASSIFAKPFVQNKIDKTLEKIDTNKDSFVSNEEMDKFLRDNYKIDLKSASKMSMEDLTNHIKKVDKEKEMNAEKGKALEREIKRNKAKINLIFEILLKQKF